MKGTSSSNHFVLIHGACHGAWCWYKLLPLLKSAGHRVTALDMAGCGVHPKQWHQIGSMSEYFQPLMEFMSSLPHDQKVVLVGHSMGGASISAAMERFPDKVAAAVFVAAFMPGPKLSYLSTVHEYVRRLDSYMDSEFLFDQEDNTAPSAVNFGTNFMASKLVLIISTKTEKIPSRD